MDNDFVFIILQVKFVVKKANENRGVYIQHFSI